MSKLVVSLPDPKLQEALGPIDGVEYVPWQMDGPAPRSVFDIVVPPYLGGNRALQHLEGVTAGLVQWQSIGYNGVAKYLGPEQRFANAATVHETSTAELALGLTLAAQREIPRFVRQGDRAIWEGGTAPSLADRRVLLIGYGGVSKAIDARLAPFEVTATRIARSAREEPGPSGDPVVVHGLDALHERLAEAEIVIIAVPLSPETRGMLDASALSALPDGALIVNVARGPVIDTDALVAELQSGRLRAAVDVTDPEPLPAEHPLWSCPNTLISPHVGGDTTAMIPRMARLLRRQIDHLLAGEELENLIQL